MRATDGPDGWGWVTRLLHWTVAVLVLFQLALGLAVARLVPDVLARFTLTQTHKSVGVVVLALAGLRIAWRVGNRRPPLPPMPRWQAGAARASHATLYGLMVLLPVSGWLLASASPVQDLLGIENRVFGTWALPDPFVPGDAALTARLHALHAAAALALALVIAVHVGAALFHELVRRDGLIARMAWRR